MQSWHQLRWKLWEPRGGELSRVRIYAPGVDSTISLPRMHFGFSLAAPAAPTLMNTCPLRNHAKFGGIQLVGSISSASETSHPPAGRGTWAASAPASWVMVQSAHSCLRGPAWLLGFQRPRSPWAFTAYGNGSRSPGDWAPSKALGTNSPFLLTAAA